jgi:hypothetical protein
MKDALASKQRLNLAIADTASDTANAPHLTPIGPRCDEKDFDLAVARWLAAFAVSAKFSATGPTAKCSRATSRSRFLELDEQS